MEDVYRRARVYEEPQTGVQEGTQRPGGCDHRGLSGRTEEDSYVRADVPRMERQAHGRQIYLEGFAQDLSGSVHVLVYGSEGTGARPFEIDRWILAGLLGGDRPELLLGDIRQGEDHREGSPDQGQAERVY